jgi:dolichol-phosphate mannosyltransferase
MFSLLFGTGFSMTAAVVFSFIAAALVNYFLCIAILFRHQARWTTGGEILAYLATLLIMGLFDVGATVGLASVGLSPLTSKVLATGMGFVGNFLLRKYLVFPERSR